MSKLLLIRHGQASLFTENYDRLSEHGTHQAALVGRHWAGNSYVFDRAFSGTLSRQRGTGEQVAASIRQSGAAFPDIALRDDLNEYEAESVMTGLVPVLRERDARINSLVEKFEQARTEAEKYRGIHKLLESVTAAWIRNDYDPAEVPQMQRWADFSGRVRDAMADIQRQAAAGSTTAVFTSGGVIAVAVQSILGAPESVAGELIWRIYNASITEFTFTRDRITLDGFNSIGHIPPEARTYR